LLIGFATTATLAWADGPKVAPVVALRTSDGLAFEPQTVQVLASGAQPEVVLLSKATPSRNGPDAGALLCYAVGPDLAALVRSASVDQGRSWSSPDPVVINGWPKDLEGRRPAGPCAAQLEDGRIRLYFTVSLPSAPPSRGLPRTDPPACVYSAISNDGRTFAFEDGVRFELVEITDPEVIRLPDVPEGDARRLGPWLMFLTRDGSTLLACSRDGLTWTRDETFVWTSVHQAAPVLSGGPLREVRLYGCDRTGVVSARFDPSTGEIHADAGARFPVGSFDPAMTPRGDGGLLLICARESTDKPDRPRREPIVPQPATPEPVRPVRPSMPPTLPE
jgi:hypothetical protein